MITIFRLRPCSPTTGGRAGRARPRRLLNAQCSAAAPVSLLLSAPLFFFFCSAQLLDSAAGPTTSECPLAARACVFVLRAPSSPMTITTNDPPRSSLTQFCADIYFNMHHHREDLRALWPAAPFSLVVLHAPHAPSPPFVLFLTPVQGFKMSARAIKCIEL